jgi:hypothetical protein
MSLYIEFFLEEEKIAWKLLLDILQEEWLNSEDSHLKKNKNYIWFLEILDRIRTNLFI